jgi:hypothetical protein
MRRGHCEPDALLLLKFAFSLNCVLFWKLAFHFVLRPLETFLCSVPVILVKTISHFVAFQLLLLCVLTLTYLEPKLYPV